MATRRETAERRRALAAELRDLITRQVIAPGDALPSTRELAERHGLSVPTVCEELKPLIDQGLITSIPRVGMFAAARTVNPDLYLYIYPSSTTNPHIDFQIERLTAGFEEHASELGASSLALPDNEVLAAGNDLLHSVSGVFVWHPLRGQIVDELTNLEIPQVRNGYGVSEKGNSVPSPPDNGNADTITFDDSEGGRQATLHLLQHGHTRIAFLAVHSESPADNPRTWSRNRQLGWAEVMAQRCPDVPLISAQPERTNCRSAECGRRAGRRILPLLDKFSAVVGADDHALIGLVTVLRENDVPTEQWPAMVGFEGIPELSPYVLTSLRPPWHDVGAKAAQLLWERRSGHLAGKPVQRVVDLKLISRATSRPNWHQERGIPKFLPAS